MPFDPFQTTPAILPQLTARRWTLTPWLVAALLCVTACDTDDASSTPSDQEADAGQVDDIDAMDLGDGDADEGDEDAADAMTPPEETSLSVSPSQGAQAGYYEVTLALDEAGIDPATVTEVLVGPHKAILPRVEGDALVVMVQGAPTAGPVDVRIDHAGGAAVAREAFTYTPPLDPRFERLFAVGASLGRGVQGGSPNLHGALVAPGALLAQQLGAYFPLPLPVEGLFPVIGPSDIGAPPACEIPDVAEFISDSIQDVIPSLISPDGTMVGYQYARLDPDIAVQNLAVGNSSVADVARGPDEFLDHFLSHLVYEPYGMVGDPVVQGQLDIVEAGDPTIIISVDLFGNDIIGAFVGDAERIRPERITEEEEFQMWLEVAIRRMAETGAEVFLADLPRASLLPGAREKRRATIALARVEAMANDEDPDAAALAAAEETDALITEIDALTERYNEHLRREAANYDNVTVVPLADEVTRIEQEGLPSDGLTLTTEKFGGLLGVDGIHFTDTGYAMVTNVFIDAINAKLGTDAPPLSLDDITATDAQSPRALQEAGLPVDQCTE